MSTEEQQLKPGALLARVGNMQALVENDKDGNPVAQFTKLIEQGADPASAKIFTMAEVALLRALCDNVLQDAYRGQTQIVLRRNG